IFGPVHTGRSHQGGGAGEGRDVGIGTVREEEAHGSDVAGQGGAQEGCLTGEVDPGDVIEGRDPAADRGVFFGARVDVGPALDECGDQVESGGAVYIVLAAAAHVAIANFDGGPDGSAAPRVGRVDACIVFKKEAGDIHVVIGDGHQERRDTIGFGLIHVGFGCDKQLRNIEAAIAGCIEKGRHTAGNGVLNAAFRPATTHDAHTVGTVARTTAGAGEAAIRGLADASVRIDVGPVVD